MKIQLIFKKCQKCYFKWNDFEATKNWNQFGSIIFVSGQESESAEIGFLWGPKHEQFSNASLIAFNLKKHFETWNEVL